MENDQESPKHITTVCAHEARELMKSGSCRYLDVRMFEDFEKSHVDGAFNVPYYSQGKEKNPEFLNLVSSIFQKDDHFLVGCMTGGRSKYASMDLFKEGFKNVKNMGGGYKAYMSMEQTT
ncbi:Rhodanese-like domain-containing protein [Zostera marina]|uniref:Rhodanese-like domain-containing protein n=1 Tax=Zostera marina TaxID=29655 RepID=A0A0K9NI67_ZOSMR|nr:Rhodanese-like domain-containing protein [Zostera marina]